MENHYQQKNVLLREELAEVLASSSEDRNDRAAQLFQKIEKHTLAANSFSSWNENYLYLLDLPKNISSFDKVKHVQTLVSNIKILSCDSRTKLFFLYDIFKSLPSADVRVTKIILSAIGDILSGSAFDNVFVQKFWTDILTLCSERNLQNKPYVRSLLSSLDAAFKSGPNKFGILSMSLDVPCLADPSLPNRVTQMMEEIAKTASYEKNPNKTLYNSPISKSNTFAQVVTRVSSRISNDRLSAILDPQMAAEHKRIFYFLEGIRLYTQFYCNQTATELFNEISKVSSTWLSETQKARCQKAFTAFDNKDYGAVAFYACTTVEKILKTNMENESYFKRASINHVGGEVGVGITGPMIKGSMADYINSPVTTDSAKELFYYMEEIFSNVEFLDLRNAVMHGDGDNFETPFIASLLITLLLRLISLKYKDQKLTL